MKRKLRHKDMPKSVGAGILMTTESEKWIRKVSSELDIGIGHILGLLVEHAREDRATFWAALHGKLTFVRGVPKRVHLNTTPVRQLAPRADRPKLTLVKTESAPAKPVAVAPATKPEELPGLPDILGLPELQPEPRAEPSVDADPDQRQLDSEARAALMALVDEDRAARFKELLRALDNPGDFLDEDVAYLEACLSELTPEERKLRKHYRDQRARIYESWLEVIRAAVADIKKLKNVEKRAVVARQRRKATRDRRALQQDLMGFLEKIRAGRRILFEKYLDHDVFAD